MSVTLLNTFDATDRILSSTENRASFNTVEGQLAASKNYVVQDQDGAVGFLTGLYFQNNWRNTEVDERNEAGQTIFDSLVGNLQVTRNDDGFLTQIQGKSVITTLLQWAVESNLSDTTFKVASAHSVGDTLIDLDTGTDIIETPALVTFEDSLVPRYHVLEQTDNGSATIQIRLSRGLEEPLSIGNDVRLGS